VLWQSPAERKAAGVSWSKADGITVKRAGNPGSNRRRTRLIDALPTGKHFPLLVYDDPINEGNVTNPDQVKKATEQMQLSFSLGDAQGTRKWFIGTRYHFSDTYAYIMENQIAKARIHRATDTGTLNGNPVFLTKGGWEQVKREQRGVVAAQFLQNPLAGQENTFTTQWLREFWVRPRLCNVYIAVDPSMGRNKTSDRTAIAVAAVDSEEHKHLVDGFCHRMQLQERWEHVRDMHKKWAKMPGVQHVKVGYERYGMQSDLEYFSERMRIENYWFEIHELNWVGERPGGESKKARVERLEPHFRRGHVLVPARVWHPGRGNAENHARWYLEEGSDEIKYEPCPGLHGREREAKRQGEHWRLFEPLMRRDEDGQLYDVTRVFFEEFALFPFSPRDDFVDALSRVIDLQPQAPMVFEQMSPEDHSDY
jgi:hypothetical protein